MERTMLSSMQPPLSLDGGRITSSMSAAALRRQMSHPNQPEWRPTGGGFFVHTKFPDLTLPPIREPPAPPKPQQSSLEQQILRCILIREGYVRRLRDVVEEQLKLKSQTKKLQARSVSTVPISRRRRKSAEERKRAQQRMQRSADLAETLQQLRHITCETVECLVKWRERHAQGFVWNKQDYMLQMCRDVNFLRPVRAKMVKALVAAEKRRKLRHRSFQGDLEVNPLETIPLETLAKLVASTDRIVLLFDEMDTSGDQQLQRGEFVQLLARLNITLSSDELAHFYYALDRDGNGEIDCKEFLNALRATDAVQRADALRLHRAEAALQAAWQHANAAGGGGSGSGGGGGSAEHAGFGFQPGGPGQAVQSTELGRLFFHAETEVSFAQMGITANVGRLTLAVPVGSAQSGDVRERIKQYGDHPGHDGRHNHLHHQDDPNHDHHQHRQHHDDDHHEQDGRGGLHHHQKRQHHNQAEEGDFSYGGGGEGGGGGGGGGMQSSPPAGQPPPPLEPPSPASQQMTAAAAAGGREKAISIDRPPSSEGISSRPSTRAGSSRGGQRPASRPGQVRGGVGGGGGGMRPVAAPGFEL